MIVPTQRYSSQDYEFRHLQESDYSNGIFEVLSQLTKAPVPSYQDFKQFWIKQSSSANKHINIVGLDRKNNQIVAFGSIIIVNTVLWGRIGKIQNIVTSKKVRGKGLGLVIINALKEEGWKQHCSKISLFCEQKNVKFYEKLGFKLQGEIYACYKK